MAKTGPKPLISGVGVESMTTKERMSFYHRSYKKTLFDHYGWKCACCSETMPLFLTIDHVQNDGFKDKNKNGKRITGLPLYLKIIREGFGTRYQVLCMNCNHGKRMNNGICPHTLI